MPLATETHQLAPAAPIGMAVRADIAPVDPAVVRTRGMRAEVTGGLDVAPTPSGEGHPGWRRARHRRVRRGPPVTQFTFGLSGEAGKGFRVAFASGRLRHRRRGLVDAPKPENKQHQEDEESIDERIKNQVESHAQPLYSGGT
jgi:hypothetical protein